jgi:hypothetical protein
MRDLKENPSPVFSRKNRKFSRNIFVGYFKNGFDWENVKHLIVRPTLIHDTGTAVQKSHCAKKNLEELDRF